MTYVKRRHPFYNRKWDTARRDWLCWHPLCKMCQDLGRVTPATVVDHIRPHKGNAVLFWDRSNWQSLCVKHHSSFKQIQEKLGPDASAECDERGYPRNSTW